ncbi:MAG: hypothetical protein WBW61_13190, partial [Rhodanobacteraceae bacterium]
MSLRNTRLAARALFCLAATVLTGPPAIARQGELPYSLAHPTRIAGAVPIIDVVAIDATRVRADQNSSARAAIGPHEKRLRIAQSNPVAITPERDGLWQSLSDGSLLWRVQVRARGATDLHLGFDRFELAGGSTLYAIGSHGYYQGPYTAADATAEGFWIPMLPGDTATVELRVPAAATQAPGSVELGDVGAGFRDLFHPGNAILFTGPGTSGACNVNVVCPLGEPYGNEIRAVAYYEFQSTDPDTGEPGTYICSGTLVSDVPHDLANYFLTAAHCVSRSSEAASMRVYWNYRSSQCATTGGYTLADNQSGARLRASDADVDFSLVELNQDPEPDWHVYYAGWDASNMTPTGTISIHHPNGDVAKITAGPRPTTTPNCVDSGAPNNHWQTGPYTQGTTEGGSSGSGLFVPAATGANARLLIGTLTGGTAMCDGIDPSQPDDGYDCYGKLASGWDGADASSRLRDWLDPADTGTLINAGIDSQAT